MRSEWKTLTGVPIADVVGFVRDNARGGQAVHVGTDSLQLARVSVHIDANPVARHRSSAYVQELVGLVVSQGFGAVVKPESWAASRSADRMVRVAAVPPATPSASEEKRSFLGHEGAA